MKEDIPHRVWTNPKGYMLLFTIALLVMASGLGFVLDRYAPRVARWLMALDDRMAGVHGLDWEEYYEITPFPWIDDDDPAD